MGYGERRANQSQRRVSACVVSSMERYKTTGSIATPGNNADVQEGSECDDPPQGRLPTAALRSRQLGDDRAEHVHIATEHRNIGNAVALAARLELLHHLLDRADEARG